MSVTDLNPVQMTDAALLSDVPEVVARVYAEAQAALTAWRSALADIEPHLHAVMEGHSMKRLELPGVGMLEASRRIKRTGWRHDDLLGDIARAVGTNRRLTNDGELEPAEWTMARLVSKCVSLGSGKVTGIREVLSAEPDEYCEVGDAEPQIRLTLFDRSPS